MRSCLLISLGLQKGYKYFTKTVDTFANLPYNLPTVLIGLSRTPLLATDMATGDRLRIQNLGEYYNDALTVEAFIKNRSTAAEANSLLSAQLYRRKDSRESMVRELARKRGISFEEMWDAILAGTAEQMFDFEPPQAEE